MRTATPGKVPSVCVLHDELAHALWGQAVTFGPHGADADAMQRLA